ncbi:MAG: type IV pilus secretin PilQ [Anaeromyxobacter sp.]
MISTSTRLSGLHRRGWLALLALLAAGPARAADRNEIRAVEAAATNGAVELVIQGSRAPSYTVFKLQDPPRLVVDLTGADVSKVAPLQVGQGGVLAVTTAQYQDDKNAVGRVIVALDGPREYEVAPRGDAVVVRVLDDKATAAATAPAPVEPEPAAELALAPPPPPPEAPAAAPLAAAPAPAPADPNLVSRRLSVAKVAKPARALLKVGARTDRVVLQLDGGVAKVEVIELANPPRLALDLHGVRKAPKGAQDVSAAGFDKVRFGRPDADTVRVVLDAAGELPRYELARAAGGVAVVVKAAPATAAAPVKQPARSVTLPSATPKAGAAAGLADLRFRQAASGARVEIDGKARFTVTRPDDRTAVLSLEGATLPKKLERTLDTSALAGPVQLLSAFNQPATGQVKVVATLRAPAEDRIVETPNGLAWVFEPRGSAPAQARAPVEAAANAPAAAGFGTEAPGYALSGAPQARGYTGRRITLDFHDIEIRNLLRLISDVSKKNIVVADDVKGKVTVTLRNVPWDQALDIVLRSKGLGKEEMGNVIRIAKYDLLAEEAKSRAEAEKSRQPTLPIKVRIIPVNFARAADVATKIKDLLTERGSATVDERTNVIVVKDVQEALVRAEGLVRNLDTEIPQVLIESRIVEASSNFSRALGVQWGGNAAFTQATGNPTGAVFPNNVAVTGGSSNSGNSIGTASAPNYAVSLPAAVGDGSGGALGFIFGSAGGAFNLNLRLSALENSGEAKTVSAPKIATVDNKEATIGQGISIPFSQTSASGVNTVFIEAKLELKVTPHVSADGSILLKIKATNNTPNPQLTGANNQPSIQKREAETEVLVKDGETTVIGGIYTRSTSNGVRKVPFFGNLPLLGYFFRSNTETDDHTELLIFITPRVLNRQPAPGAAGN